MGTFRENAWVSLAKTPGDTINRLPPSLYQNKRRLLARTVAAWAVAASGTADVRENKLALRTQRYADRYEIGLLTLRRVGTPR